MQYKQYVFKYALSILVLLVVAWGGYYYGQKNEAVAPVTTVATTTTYTTYTNEVYGYSVGYEEQSLERRKVEGIKNIETEIFKYFPEQGHNAVEFTWYTKNGQPRVLGRIYCTEAVHKLDILGDYKNVPGLRADMPLREYADTIYEDKVTHDFPIIERVALDAKETFAGREAFNFIVAEKTNTGHSGILDINHYIITENSRSKRCIIRYPEFDSAIELDPGIFEARQHWINSFRWVEVK
jgi:hypothetical protein